MKAYLKTIFTVTLLIGLSWSSLASRDIPPGLHERGIDYASFNIPCSSIVSEEISLEAEPYIDDIPFSTKEIVSSYKSKKTKDADTKVSSHEKLLKAKTIGVSCKD